MPPDPTGGPIIEERSLWRKLRERGAGWQPLSVLRLGIALVGMGVFSYSLLSNGLPSNGSTDTHKQTTVVNTSDTPPPDNKPVAAPGQIVIPASKTEWLGPTDGDVGCYRITPPAGASTSSSGGCGISLYYNGQLQSQIQIRSNQVHQGGSLAAYANDWRAVCERNSNTILSETAAKIGAYDAVKFTFRYNKGIHNQALWEVYTGPRYKLGNYVVDDFTLFGDYQTPEEIKSFDALIASLVWQ